MKKIMMTSLAGAIFTLTAGSALAAAPADWSKVPATSISLLYPGVSPIEWITKGTEHGGARTMPGAAETKTKYVKGGSLADGVFYDLNQWRSGENKAYDGYVATERVMEGGQALVSADGKLTDGVWTVEFTRKLRGGEGDVALESGKTYNFGFAIHDDSSIGRFHHVSLGYKLGIDTEADITALKQ